MKVIDKDKQLRAYTMLLAVLAALFFGLMFFLLGQKSLGILSMVFLGLFGLCFLLNQYNHKNISRFLLLNVGFIMLTTFATLCGKESNFQLIFIVAVCSLFSFYRLREWPIIVAYMLVALVAIIFLELTNYQYFGENNLNDDSKSILNYSNYGFSMVLTVLLCFNMQLNYKRILSIVNKEKTKSSAIIENTADAIWLLDSKLKTSSFNNSFSILVRSVSGKMLKIGDTLVDILNNNEKHAEWWLKNLERGLSGNSFEKRFDTQLKDKTHYFKVSFNAVKLENDVIGVSVFIQDITSQELAAQKITEAAEAQKVKSWVHNGISIVTTNMLQSKENRQQMLSTFINAIVQYVDGIQAALYLYQIDEACLTYCDGYAFSIIEENEKKINIGQGLIGQVAKDLRPKELTNL